MDKEKYIPPKAEILELNLEKSILIGSLDGKDDPPGISKDGYIYNLNKIDNDEIEQEDPWDLAF